VGALAVIAFNSSTSVAEGPGIANGKTVEQYSEDIKDKFIPQKLSQAAEVKPTVEALAEQATNPNSRWDYFRGAGSEVVEQSRRQDIEELTGDSFSKCQPQNYQHSYTQIMTQPMRQQLPGAMCGTWFKFPGPSSGLAFRCIPQYWCQVCGPFGGPCCACCHCVCQWHDIVDYYFPTSKLDSSEQMYQSRYLDTSLVATMAEENEQKLENAKHLFKDDLKLLQAITLGALAQRGITGVRASAIGDGTREQIEDFFQAREQVKGNAEQKDIISASPDQTNIYTRNLFEQLNLASQSFWWIPHNSRYHFFGSDLPGGILFAKHLSLSKIMFSKYSNFISSGGGGACVGHNIKSGKSPKGLGDFNETTNDQLCLTKIGERFSPVDGGRLNITDRTYRGLAKDLDLFYALANSPAAAAQLGLFGGVLKPHTYQEKVDKLLVLRNEKLKEEQPICASLPNIVKHNVEYDRANVKDVKSGGASTHEMFTAFRGAWGLKGVEDSYFYTTPGCPGGSCTSTVACPVCSTPCINGIVRFAPPNNGSTADSLAWPNRGCFRLD